MGGSETSVWHSDRDCPAWCVTGSDHLQGQLRTGGDFWHAGEVIPIHTTDTDHNWNPVSLDIRVMQREQVDERGHTRHPAEVVIEQGWGFTPRQARVLAVALNQLADAADAVEFDGGA